MNRDVRVGILFMVSLAILATALYYLGSFREQVSYKIEFEKVLGLARDSPIQFNGVPIGRVTQIELGEAAAPGERVTIIVTINVQRSARNHIRSSTVADIRSIGILGDKSVLLVTDDYNAPVLEENDFIKPSPNTLDVAKLLAQGTDMVADATAVTNDLKLLLDRLVNEDGTLQSLIGDKKMSTDVKQIVARLLSYLESDQSTMSLLLKDPEFAQLVKARVETITGSLSTFSSDLNNPDGLLPLLLQDPTFRDQVSGKVLTLLDNSNQYVERLANGRGLLHKMTQDEDYATRVAANLEKASYHLSSILEKIDEGEGSASLLVNDPSLYKGLYEVVYGLEHSGISKWYLQKKQKRGNKLLTEEKKEEGNP